MNLINERRSIMILIELHKRKYIDLNTRKELRKTLVNYNTTEEFLLDLISQYNIYYHALPNYLKNDYQFLAKACVARPKTLLEIFSISFHNLAEVLKLIAEEDVLAILDAESEIIYPAVRKSILNAKGISKQSMANNTEISCV